MSDRRNCHNNHSHNLVVPGKSVEELKKLRTDYPGRGPHTLTGPIFITGAEPGDVLKIKINRIVPRAYGTNFNLPRLFGQFPTKFQDVQVKYLYLDMNRSFDLILPRIAAEFADNCCLRDILLS